MTDDIHDIKEQEEQLKAEEKPKSIDEILNELSERHCPLFNCKDCDNNTICFEDISKVKQEIEEFYRKRIQSNLEKYHCKQISCSNCSLYPLEKNICCVDKLFNGGK